MIKAKDIKWSLLAVAAVVLSVALGYGDVSGGGVKGEALSAPPQHAPLVDSIRGPSLTATKGDVLAKEYEDELEDVGGRRGGFLSTSGSFTLSSGGNTRAGNYEE